MQVLKVIPKEIFVAIEFSYRELVLLREGLDATELNIDPTSELGSKVDEFMKTVLYPTILNLLEELDGVDSGINS